MALEFNRTAFQTPLDEAEVRRTVDSAYGFIDADIEYLMPAQAVERVDKYGFFIARLAGRNYVWEELKDGEVERYQQIQFNDFNNYFPNIKVVTGRSTRGENTYQSLGAWWIEHTGRRYDLALFNPNMKPVYFSGVNKVRNLWDGFKYEAVHHRGMADSFLSHLQENICENNVEVCEYMLDWLSALVQYPGNKTNRATTIVLQGDQGTGKGFFVNHIGRLIGKAYSYINMDSFALQEFNGLLENKLLVFFDEVVWSRDRKKANYVKSLITERSMAINQKFINAYAVNDYMSFILSTNHFGEGAYVEGENERRFLVVNVSDKHKSEQAYFKKIEDDLNNGGFEELMHVLGSRDISKRDFEKIPVTEAKRETVAMNLDEFKSWLYQRVMADGFVAADERGVPTLVMFGSANLISSTALYENYRHEVTGRPDTFTGFILRMQRALPTMMKNGKHKKNRGSYYELPDTSTIREELRMTIGVSFEPNGDEVADDSDC